MLYQINGHDNEGNNYSTRIDAKSPIMASKLATGNLIQAISTIFSLDKNGNIKNVWKWENNRLVKI